MKLKHLPQFCDRSRAGINNLVNWGTDPQSQKSVGPKSPALLYVNQFETTTNKAQHLMVGMMIS